MLPPSGARFARPGGHPPAAGLGRAVSASRCACPSSQSSPCSPCGLCVAPGCSGRPLTLPHPQNAPTGLSEPRGYVQAAFRGHRAPNSPRRASTASRRAFWACMVFTSSASVVSRSAPAPSPFGFDALADGSIDRATERLALSMGGSDRRVSGLGRHPADGPRSRPRPFLAILGID